eukprot:Clim_evm73s77 gene=Clim_evmTU73s77
MTSVIKKKLIAGLGRFTKNLQPSDVDISIMKGTGYLKEVELDEVYLQASMFLPACFRIVKASAEDIGISLSFTKIQREPVVLNVGRVNVVIEVCEDKQKNLDLLRQMAECEVAKGTIVKYGFIEKVIDGLTLNVKRTKVDIRGSYPGCPIQTILAIDIDSMSLRAADASFLPVTDIRKAIRPRGNSIMVGRQLTMGTAAFSIIPKGEDKKDDSTIYLSPVTVNVEVKRETATSEVLAARLVMLLESLAFSLSRSQLVAMALFTHLIDQLLYENAVAMVNEDKEEYRKEAMRRSNPDLQVEKEKDAESMDGDALEGLEPAAGDIPDVSESTFSVEAAVAIVRLTDERGAFSMLQGDNLHLEFMPGRSYNSLGNDWIEGLHLLPPDESQKLVERIITISLTNLAVTPARDRLDHADVGHTIFCVNKGKEDLEMLRIELTEYFRKEPLSPQFEPKVRPAAWMRLQPMQMMAVPKQLIALLKFVTPLMSTFSSTAHLAPETPAVDMSEVSSLSDAVAIHMDFNVEFLGANLVIPPLTPSIAEDAVSCLSIGCDRFELNSKLMDQGNAALVHCLSRWLFTESDKFPNDNNAGDTCPFFGNGDKLVDMMEQFPVRLAARAQDIHISFGSLDDLKKESCLRLRDVGVQLRAGDFEGVKQDILMLHAPGEMSVDFLPHYFFFLLKTVRAALKQDYRSAMDAFNEVATSLEGSPEPIVKKTEELISFDDDVTDDAVAPKTPPEPKALLLLGTFPKFSMGGASVGVDVNETDIFCQIDSERVTLKTVTGYLGMTGAKENDEAGTVEEDKVDRVLVRALMDEQHSSVKVLAQHIHLWFTEKHTEKLMEIYEKIPPKFSSELVESIQEAYEAYPAVLEDMTPPASAEVATKSTRDSNLGARAATLRNIETDFDVEILARACRFGVYGRNPLYLDQTILRRPKGSSWFFGPATTDDEICKYMNLAMKNNCNEMSVDQKVQRLDAQVQKEVQKRLVLEEQIRALLEEKNKPKTAENGDTSGAREQMTANLKAAAESMEKENTMLIQKIAELEEQKMIEQEKLTMTYMAMLDEKENEIAMLRRKAGI